MLIFMFPARELIAVYMIPSLIIASQLFHDRGGTFVMNKQNTKTHLRFMFPTRELIAASNDRARLNIFNDRDEMSPTTGV